MNDHHSDAPASPPEPGDAYFVPAGVGSRHDLFPGVAITTTAGRAMMLSVVTFEPGSVVPDHAHPHEQMGLMVSGRAEFTVGELTRVLGPGDIWKIPGGVVHRVRALDGPAVALDVFHPIREDYL
jgi:quercetin dioxygenase-like cupin family protein